MPIASDALRGYTEIIILRQLIEHDSYGYEINKRIQQKTSGEYEFKEATLYTAFRRLEQSGYIFSYWGNEKTGARRRYYSITKEGREYYDIGLAQWKRTKKLIEQLIL